MNSAVEQNSKTRHSSYDRMEVEKVPRAQVPTERKTRN